MPSTPPGSAAVPAGTAFFSLLLGAKLAVGLLCSQQLEPITAANSTADLAGERPASHVAMAALRETVSCSALVLSLQQLQALHYAGSTAAPLDMRTC